MTLNVVLTFNVQTTNLSRMNSAQDILRRWVAMDHALGSFDGLHVPSFAKHWQVSTRTIYRDLAVFNAMDHPATHELDADDVRTVWRYEGGVEWLFVSNLSSSIRKAMRKLAGQYRREGTK